MDADGTIKGTSNAVFFGAAIPTKTKSLSVFDIGDQYTDPSRLTMTKSDLAPVNVPCMLRGTAEQPAKNSIAKIAIAFIFLPKV